ncbi:hypothetical protein COCNU_08G001690 [Cocos nucifera]|uniref:Uncharacterized protein n=1 Tax=Cocos nucifera TaxID=13894 RepID=A0A8K0N5C3_COCNU|nr:hypothetical protein COCNU_08G001690 [Cocos nucifera]
MFFNLDLIKPTAMGKLIVDVEPTTETEAAAIIKPSTILLGEGLHGGEGLRGRFLGEGYRGDEEIHYGNKGWRSAAQELLGHFNDMVAMYKAVMVKLADTYEKMLRVDRSVAEELQEKVRLIERHAATTMAKILMEVMEASRLAYDLGFDECRTLV